MSMIKTSTPVRLSVLAPLSVFVCLAAARPAWSQGADSEAAARDPHTTERYGYSGAADGGYNVLDVNKNDADPGTYGSSTPYAVVGDGATRVCSGGNDNCRDEPPGKLVYNSTRGTHLINPSPLGFRIADDIYTTAIPGCGMTAYVVRVSGGVEGGGGEFSCTVEMFDGCPSAGGELIEGAGRRFEGLSDAADVLHDLMIDVSGAPIPIPSTVWIRLYFDIPTAGWLAGEPPDFGYSPDGYDHPFTSCGSWFGGYPEHPHASFHAQVFVEEECRIESLVYLTESSTEPAFIPFGGAEGVRLADDLRLIVEGCELSGYEIGIRGTEGPYEMSIDLRGDPEVGAIPGTESVFHGVGDGSLEIARVIVEPGIVIPEHVWVTWRTDKPDTGVVNVGDSHLGSSGYFFMMKDYSWYPGWVSYPTPSRDAVFHAAVYCRGETAGACCFRASDSHPAECRDSVGLPNCTGSSMPWAPGMTCDEGPFYPPCTACGQLEQSNPPHCSIDARQPSMPDGTDSDEGRELELVFDNECFDSWVNWSHLRVEVFPEGPPTPDWSSQDDSDWDNKVTVRFSRGIPPGHWTCVTHTPTGKRACLGYLPGDVNGDSTSNPAIDLSALIDCLNTPGSCEYRHEDINRDGTTGVADLTRLIDLFNGAAAYENWSGAHLPECP